MCLEREQLPEGGKILLLREGDVVPVGPLSPDLSDPNDTGYKIETLAPSPRRFTAICNKIIVLNHRHLQQNNHAKSTSLYTANVTGAQNCALHSSNN